MGKKEDTVAGLGRFLEADAVRICCATTEDMNERDAVTMMANLSVAVSLKRIADALGKAEPILPPGRLTEEIARVTREVMAAKGKAVAE